MSSEPPWRLLLDTGTIIAGITQRWGAAKAVLILALEHDRFRVVLTEVVQDELDRYLMRQGTRLSADTYDRLLRDYRGWLSRARYERWPRPSAAALSAASTRIPPVLRHINDVPGVVAAMEAQADWTISSNDERWTGELGRRIGLHIVTPNQFLRLLAPSPPDEVA